ncbi:hypothetical protein [Curtobacterium sp. Arg-1]|uniref:hypothetical protein n=1 Tax=Curtobacterium sp. Arg-1 TaxID=2935040 RepID=UPI0021D8E42C|nr:hypothetical protein [Curtobacterium sp. Arg-1]UXZ57056.1 hypothetical protein MXD64_13760 [Curtobacterium sp. Arg-1]
MTDIQQARDVLAKWREDATAGQWVVDLDRGESFGAVDTPDVYSESNADSVVLPAGTVAEHDIPLIVGTAGNPDLLDAIDRVLRLADIEGGAFHDAAAPFAAAILSADERMSA